jgi:PAS domain S-box-containing protein
MDPQTAQALVLAGQVAGAATAIGTAAYGVHRFVAPKVRTVVGFCRAIVSVPGQVAELAYQFRPNSGGSAIDRIVRLGERVESVAFDVRTMKATQRARGNGSADGEFECDADGLCLHSNATYVRWVERGEDQLRGMGWLTCIAEHDRDRVRDEWEACVEERREFGMRYAMVSASGNEFQVDCIAIPIREGNDILGWVGHVKRRHPTGSQPVLRKPHPDEE